VPGKIVLVALCFSLLAQATTLHTCFTGFATMSSADKDRLTLATYGELLDRVGGAKLSPEVLDAMIASQTPFDVKEIDSDLGTLKKRLQEFEELLKKKEWNTPEVRAMLLADLARRRGERAEQQTKVDVAVAKSWPDYRIATPQSSNYHDFSPDGRLMIFQELRLNKANPPRLNVVDLVTGKAELYDLPEGMSGVPQFTPDGSAVMIANPFKQYYRVPLLNGVPQLGQAKLLFPEDRTKPEAGAGHRDYTGNPERFIGQTNVGWHLFDTATGSRVRLQLDEYRDAHQAGRRTPRAGIMPGTEDPYFLMIAAGKGETYRLHVVSVDTDGKLTQKDATLTFPEIPHQLVPAVGGRFVTFENFRPVKFLVSDGLGKPFEEIATQRDPKIEFPDAQYAVAHPQHPELMLFFVRDGADREKLIVETFDLKQRKSLGTFTLHQSIYQKPIISNDGTRLVFQNESNSVSVVNLPRYLKDLP